MINRIIIAAALVLTMHPHLEAQIDQERARQEQRAKLETILRVKDLRTPYDGTLVRLLSDPDPTVRREATLAFGSIQDSNVIGALTRNLIDPLLSIQEAAAFALGQTGTVLSEDGRRALAYDLVWKRIPTTRAIEALMDGVGKFGFEDALNDLLVKFANLNEGATRRGLTKSIARFAERGIVTDDGVRFLLRFVRPPELTPRTVAYALRRIGKHPLILEELEEVVLLWRHPDPNVRMQLATLLSLVGDARVSAQPLRTLARHDVDWRVRVNSIRSLGVLPLGGDEETVDLFGELLFDRNLHVAITALSSFPMLDFDREAPSERLRAILEQVEIIAQNPSDNFPWQLQAEAADALALVEGGRAFARIHQARRSHPRLEERLLLALARTGSDSAAGVLLEFFQGDEARLQAAALEGLSELTSRRPDDTVLLSTSYDAVLRSLGVDDAQVLGTAAALLREPRFRKPESVSALIRAARGLHVPADTEILLEMIRTLGILEDSRAVPFLHDQLTSPDGVIRAAAAASLQTITGQDYTASLPKREGALVTDFDFAALRAIPDTVYVDLETTRGVISLELYPRIAPFTVLNLLKLEEQRGYYRGILFHRVVPNFVVQAGDPRGDGWGGPGWTIRSEFSALPFERGSIGMASAGKDTEGSQFFITHSWQPHLEGRYTNFGRVLTGQDVVDNIQVDDRIYGLRRSTDVKR